MLSIKLDLGKAPSVLAALADQRLAQAVVNAAAESYVDDTLDYIKAGKAFASRTGQLEQSINWLPSGNGSAEVYANATYAPYVEYGTPPHTILPKAGRKGLKIRVLGSGYIIRRKVNHPGSKPYPFFFTDLYNRQQHMQQRGLSVIAAKLAQLGG